MPLSLLKVKETSGKTCSRDSYRVIVHVEQWQQRSSSMTLGKKEEIAGVNNHMETISKVVES